VSDVFAWRGSPAAWDEDLLQVSEVTLRDANPEERKKLRRLGEHPAIATLALPEGETLDVAAGSEQRVALLGPFAATEQVPPARV
jgi:hypothetical protein